MPVASVKLGHVAGLLAGGGRQMLRWTQTAPEQRLLVLPFEHENSHHGVLTGLKQSPDLGASLSLLCTQSLPSLTPFPEQGNSDVEAREQVFPALVELERLVFADRQQGAILAAEKGQRFFAEDEKGAQFAVQISDEGGRVHGRAGVG